MQDGWSCLHIACQEGQLKVVKVLCERGGEELMMMTDKVINDWFACWSYSKAVALEHKAICV